MIKQKVNASDIDATRQGLTNHKDHHTTVPHADGVMVLVSRHYLIDKSRYHTLCANKSMPFSRSKKEHKQLAAAYDRMLAEFGHDILTPEELKEVKNGRKEIKRKG